MRTYQSLDAVQQNGEVLQLNSTDPEMTHATMALAREGQRVVISVNIGPLELALRLRFDDLQRQVASLKPVAGLATTRQVGSGQAYIGLGLTEDNRLVMRPTLVGDATGKITFNLIAAKAVFDELCEWLDCASV